MSENTQHTPTPWEIVDHAERQFGNAEKNKTIGVCYRNRIYGMNPAEARANAARILECVNALDNIEDPARFVAEAKNHAARIWSLEDKIATLSGMLTEAIKVINEEVDITKNSELLKVVEWELYIEELNGKKEVQNER